MNLIKTLKSQTGGTLLITLLIVSAVVLIIAISVNMISLDEALASSHFNKAEPVRTLGRSCYEEVLLQLKRDPNYSSTSVTLPEGICNLSITGISTTKTVQIDALLNNYQIEYEFEVDLSVIPAKINYWKKGF